VAKNTNHDTTAQSDVFRAEKLSPQRHNEKGEEILDPTPMQPPLGYKKSLSLSEQIAQQVRISLIKRLEDEMEPETDEEADDFVVGDDYEPLSKYENDHVPTIGELKKKAKQIQDAIRKKNAEAAVEMYKKSIKKPADPPAQPPDNDLTSVKTEE